MKKQGGLEATIIGSELFNRFPSVRFGISTRVGGVSPEPLGMNLSFNVGDSDENVLRNRESFLGRLGIPLDRLAMPGQVHGVNVQTVTEPGQYPECDGLVTNTRNLFLGVTVADCVPIFLADPVKMVVGAIHAGWRGTAAGIVGLAVQRFVYDFGSDVSDLVAALGPSAGSCCYNVGSEVGKSFPPTVIARRNGELHLDLREANRIQLEEAGLSEEIEVSNLCTICGDELFHSYRRDGEKSGRMIGVIGLS